MSRRFLLQVIHSKLALRKNFRVIVIGPVHTTSEEFENGGFTLKTHQMFSIHTLAEEVKNATITSHFGFVIEENSDREITWLSRRHRFPKALFSKFFLPPLKRKAGVFKFLRFEERFRKAPLSCRISVDGRPNRRNKAGVFKFLRFEERFRLASFSCRISVDGRPNRRNKAAFSNSSGVVVDGALYNPHNPFVTIHQESNF